MTKKEELHIILKSLKKVFEILERLKHKDVQAEGLDKSPNNFTLGEIAMMELNSANYSLALAEKIIRTEFEKPKKKSRWAKGGIIKA